VRRRTRRQHIGDHAIGPCGNDPIDRSDRPAAPIDHDAHEDLAGIDGAQQIFVLHNEARIVVVFDGPGRREAAGRY
jgi:hypothetical protein